ncbi:hypothetical protein KO561_11105 [Radiobacillus kanasensis]|uniref:hypothetical protein n=1 Tax=Radiobacillus kanasensis TaxID=2844358 RepID=UPI001E4270AA|nr:hypothetical protein [Radiobacillus kanasensis]UFT97771.1 hypothetical protein KO561_11105 [Radiobacillus kanasensis]
MKRLFPLLKKEEGFLFPYMIGITAITLLALLSSLTVYQNHLQSTAFLEEHLRIESLLQLSKKTFRTEYVKKKIGMENGTLHYSFPDGTVDIQYSTLPTGEIQVIFQVETDQEANYYSKQRLNFPSK